MSNDQSMLIPLWQMEEILDGIPDAIKIFSSDCKIYFCNKECYKFYNKDHEEIIGKTCYEILGRKEKCKECGFDKVMETKQRFKKEMYIPEVNKVIEVCYSPLFNENMEVVFVMEQLRDITEKKISDKALKKDKDRYKQIVNNFHDPLLIVVDNKIEIANTAALNIFQMDSSELINSCIYKYFNERYSKILHKKFKRIISDKKLKDLYDCELNLKENNKVSVQLTSSYIVYEEKEAICISLTNTDYNKKQLMRASQFQRNSLQKSFPGENFMKVTSIYAPAYIVSGDFYRICEIDEGFIIGILIDVQGNGASAALNISALELMFKEEIEKKQYSPIKIVENLNKKLFNYYEENYIAVSCFSLDFLKGEFAIVGAGINQFIFQKKGEQVENKIAEGTFLGMFKDSIFSEIKLSISSGDRIFLFSDGFDFIFDEDNVVKRYMGKVSIEQFKKYLDEYIEDTILEEGKLKDDFTMLAMEIK